MAKYRYWAVDCKTKECGKILLDCIGPYSEYHHPVIPVCDDFQITCDGCTTTHTYGWNDLQDVLHTVPGAEFVPARTFRDAVQRGQERGGSQSAN